MYLVQEADVVKGDLVITSGEGSIFPEGIPIGKVVEVKKEDYELFCDVKVLPLIEFTKLEEVLVIRRKKL
jgi:rod shape-determining protein MreC